MKTQLSIINFAALLVVIHLTIFQTLSTEAEHHNYSKSIATTMFDNENVLNNIKVQYEKISEHDDNQKRIQTENDILGNNPTNVANDVREKSYNISDQAQYILNQAAANADLVIKFVGILFTLLGIFGFVIGFIGYKEIRSMQKQREEAQEMFESTTILLRASHQMILADITKDKLIKDFRLRVGLLLIDNILRKNTKIPEVYNWQAYALKRLGLNEEALDATEKALKIVPEGSYEHHRALYNKACYMALLGKKEEAVKAIKYISAIDKLFAQAAKDDPDLISIKTEIDQLNTQ